VAWGRHKTPPLCDAVRGAICLTALDMRVPTRAIIGVPRPSRSTL
jgi:hypothetical protein